MDAGAKQTAMCISETVDLQGLQRIVTEISAGDKALLMRDIRGKWPELF